MVCSCCAVNCTNRFIKGSGLGFFKFPINEERKMLWINAVRRNDWTPSKHTYICGKHFQTGRPNKDKNHPDYIPNVFSFSSGFQRNAQLYEKRKRRLAGNMCSKKSRKENEVAPVDILVDIPNNSPVSDHTSERLQEKVERLMKENEQLKLENKQIKEKYKELEKKLSLSLLTEMNALRTENRHLKSQLEENNFSTNIFKDKKLMKYYTGIEKEEVFIWIVAVCEEFIDTNFKIEKKIQLLICLLKLRLDLDFKDIGIRLNISRRTVTRVIGAWLPVLAGRLKHLICWPSHEDIKMSIPPCFKNSLFSNATCIIDCTEVFTERSSNMQNKNLMWSNYKHHQTLKVLIVILPSGQISYVSECWGGRVSDQELTRESNLLEHLKPGDVVLADRGFNLSDDFALNGVRLVVPSYTKGKKQLSKKEVLHSKQTSNVRVHVERVIGKMKTFKILKNIMPIKFIKYANLAVISCAAIVNLSSSVIK